MLVRASPACITSVTCTLSRVSPHKIAVRDAHFFYLPHAHVLGISSSVHLSVSLSLSLLISSQYMSVCLYMQNTHTHTQLPSPFSATDLWKSDSNEKCREMTCSASFSKGLECTGICVLPRASAKAKRLLVEPGFSPRSVLI